MMIRKYYKFIVLLFGSAIISFSSACETTPTRQAPLPGEPVCKAPNMVDGDTWVYRDWSSHYGKDVYQRKVIDVEEDGSFAVVVMAKKADTVKIYNFDANYRQINPPTDKQLLDFPLFVGKKWSDQYEGGAVDGKRYKYKSTYKVRSHGTVTTEAGTFKAFEIRRGSYNISLHSKSWVTYWYSPEIKLIVKEKPDWRIGRELISYTLETSSPIGRASLPTHVIFKELDLVHLGDNDSELIHNFSLEEIPQDPTLVIVCSNVTSSDSSYSDWVILNGKKIDRLNNHFARQSNSKRKIIILINPNLLKIGENQLKITSGYSNKNLEYDDYNIFEITLLGNI